MYSIWPFVKVDDWRARLDYKPLHLVFAVLGPGENQAVGGVPVNLQNDPVVRFPLKHDSDHNSNTTVETHCTHNEWRCFIISVQTFL